MFGDIGFLSGFMNFFIGIILGVFLAWLYSTTSVWVAGFSKTIRACAMISVITCLMAFIYYAIKQPYVTDDSIVGFIFGILGFARGTLSKLYNGSGE